MCEVPVMGNIVSQVVVSFAYFGWTHYQFERTVRRRKDPKAEIYFVFLFPYHYDYFFLCHCTLCFMVFLKLFHQKSTDR